MWCDKCNVDVVPVMAGDSPFPACPVCKSQLSVSRAGTQPAETPAALAERKPLHDPRELLARWAREDALEAIDHGTPAARDAGAESRTQVRFDVPHPVVPPQTPIAGRGSPSVAGPFPQPAAVPEMPAQDVVIHPPHAFSPPHFYIPAPAPASTDKSSRWMTMVGQLCAYAGVGGLTVGTVLVLMGYFGGPASYATTGWLIATAGQMLLFLGVITLVSGGMEQTTQEVASRVETLHARLGSLEAAWTTRPPGNNPPS